MIQIPYTECYYDSIPISFRFFFHSEMSKTQREREKTKEKTVDFNIMYWTDTCLTSFVYTIKGDNPKKLFFHNRKFHKNTHHVSYCLFGWILFDSHVNVTHLQFYAVRYIHTYVMCSKCKMFNHSKQQEENRAQNCIYFGRCCVSEIKNNTRFAK